MVSHDVKMMLVFHVEEDSWTESISFPSSMLDDKSFLCNIADYKQQLCVTKRVDQNSINMILELWKLHSGESVWKLDEIIAPPFFLFVK